VKNRAIIGSGYWQYGLKNVSLSEGEQLFFVCSAQLMSIQIFSFLAAHGMEGMYTSIKTVPIFNIDSR
jgi:hypothetical protein